MGVLAVSDLCRGGELDRLFKGHDEARYFVVGNRRQTQSEGHTQALNESLCPQRVPDQTGMVISQLRIFGTVAYGVGEVESPTDCDNPAARSAISTAPAPKLPEPCTLIEEGDATIGIRQVAQLCVEGGMSALDVGESSGRAPRIWQRSDLSNA